MSMHLVGPYLTTTKYNSKKKKSNSKRLAAATDKHNAWLRERGLHPEQRTLQKAFKGKHQNDLPDYSVQHNNIKLSNSIGNGYKKGIMANLHKESPEVQQAILDKASRCMPLFNKGGYQFATPGTDMTMTGSKSRRG
jgi:hypothetical protein